MGFFCSEKIHVELPSNLNDTDLHYFQSRQGYSVRPQKVKHIKNVFVSHEGICLKNGLIVRKSMFNLFGITDKTFHFQFWRLTIEQFVVSTFGNSLSKKYLKNNEYLLIYTKWFGYFFWLTDSLPKLIKTQNLHKDVTVIYPEGWGSINYVNESLCLFNDLKLKIIPKGVHLQIKNLALPETRKWSNSIKV